MLSNGRNDPNISNKQGLQSFYALFETCYSCTTISSTIFNLSNLFYFYLWLWWFYALQFVLSLCICIGFLWHMVQYIYKFMKINDNINNVFDSLLMTIFFRNKLRILSLLHLIIFIDFIPIFNTEPERPNFIWKKARKENCMHYNQNVYTPHQVVLLVWSFRIN